jgi:hypothetical protein
MVTLRGGSAVMSFSFRPSMVARGGASHHFDFFPRAALLETMRSNALPQIHSFVDGILR